MSQQETESSSHVVTRREFMVGAGAGLALGAAVAGGISAASRQSTGLSRSMATSATASASTPSATEVGGASASTLTDEQAVYLQLGEKIWDQVPYDYQGIPDLGEWLTPLDGPAKDCNRDNPLSRVDVQTAAASGVISEESIRANPLSCLYWYFGNTPHAVTKAMRFEYRVKSEGTPQDRDADADGYVTKHILIGFEGVVAGA